MPPRHGKSQECSVHFPAWFLGRYPDKRIIATSYSAELSHTFSRQARNLVNTPEYQEIFPNTRLSADSRSISMWDLEYPARGGYVSAGVGGSITGKGADVLLIDDPVKDAEEARSETILQNIWDWYTTTAYTRLEGNGAVILVMTRWAEDDLVGRVLQLAQTDPNAGQWEVIRLPALAEENDPLGRPEGAALWPEKYDRATLLEIEATLGKRDFAALYQQRPAPAEGNLFKSSWWQFFHPDAPPNFQTVIQFWDTAFKEGQENDYSSCITLGVHERRVTTIRPTTEQEATDQRGKVIRLPTDRVFDLYVLDVVNKRLEFPSLLEEMIANYNKWSDKGYTIDEIVVEDKASGTSAYQSLKLTTNLPIRSVIPERDKVSRANAVTAYFEQGRVYYPRYAPWFGDYQAQMEVFPAGKHDDMVDATTGAIIRVLGRADASAFLEYMRQRAKGLKPKRRDGLEFQLPHGIELQNSLA